MRYERGAWGNDIRLYSVISNAGLTLPANRFNDPQVAARGGKQFIHGDRFIDDMRVFFAANAKTNGRHSGDTGRVGGIGAEAVSADLWVHTGAAQPLQSHLHVRVGFREDPGR